MSFCISICISYIFLSSIFVDVIACKQNTGLSLELSNFCYDFKAFLHIFMNTESTFQDKFMTFHSFFFLSFLWQSRIDPIFSSNVWLLKSSKALCKTKICSVRLKSYVHSYKTLLQVFSLKMWTQISISKLDKGWCVK